MLKENWTYKKLIEVCDIQYGYPFDSACFSTSPDDGMPLIRIRDVKDGCTSTYYKGDYPKEYIIHEGDYLVGMDGEFNIAPWKSEDALLNQRVCKVASKSTDVSNGFLYRFLIKELKKIEDETPFVTVKHLSAKRLNQVYLYIPSLSEQKHIVSELDLLQSIIDKQQAQLKELDTLAQAVFYDMFGDPVENEKGWERKRLGDLCNTITKGTTPTTLGYSFVSEGINFVKVESFKDGKIDTSKLTHITKECHDALLRSQLDDLDLLVCIAGATIGKTAIVDKSILPANTNQACAIIRLKNKGNLAYIQNYLMSKFKNDVEQMGKGVAQPNLSLGQMRELSIPFPPLSLQQSFGAKIESIEKQKATISQSITETQKLFDYTMDKYF